jgi:hypothetical protein
MTPALAGMQQMIAGLAGGSIGEKRQRNGRGLNGGRVQVAGCQQQRQRRQPDHGLRLGS